MDWGLILLLLSIKCLHWLGRHYGSSNISRFSIALCFHRHPSVLLLLTVFAIALLHLDSAHSLQFLSMLHNLLQIHEFLFLWIIGTEGAMRHGAWIVIFEVTNSARAHAVQSWGGLVVRGLAELEETLLLGQDFAFCLGGEDLIWFVYHLNEYLFCILESLVHRWVFAFQVTGERQFFYLLFRTDKGDHSIATAQNQLRGILEQHLYNFIAESEEHCLFSSFPLLQEAQCGGLTLRRVLLCESELYWLEFLVPI